MEATRYDLVHSYYYAPPLFFCSLNPSFFLTCPPCVTLAAVFMMPTTNKDTHTHATATQDPPERLLFFSFPLCIPARTRCTYVPTLLDNRFARMSQMRGRRLELVDVSTVARRNSPAPPRPQFERFAVYDG